MNKGLLIVLSGPSGCGKGTLTKGLLDNRDTLKLSVSATTRAMREYEQNGVDYYFYSREEFQKLIDDDEMLEYACYNGQFYGTPKKPVVEWLNKGYDVILEIEVAGAEQVRSRMNTVDIFVLPPSLEELERRLRNRNSESDEQINARLDIAQEEMKQVKCYCYTVINDDVKTAVSALDSILTAEKAKTKHILKQIEDVLRAKD